MSRYLNRLINELRMQLCYSPERRRLEQLERLEQFVTEIKPTRAYRFDQIAIRITNYRPSKATDQRIPGADLRYDLAILMEDLSILVDVAVADLPERVYSTGQLMDMFDVSPSVIYEWRIHGLPVRYYVMADGVKRMGVRHSAIDAFMGGVVAAAVRSPRFSRASEKQILGEATRLLGKSAISFSQLAALLREKFGLNDLAAKCIIRAHDAGQPGKAFYHDTYDPMPEQTKLDVFNANRDGLSVQRLASMHNRSRQDIYRMVRQVKAERLIGDGVEFIRNDEFEAADADRAILNISPGEHGHVGRRDTPVPSYLTDLCKVPLLGKEEEPDLFRRYNYLKHRLHKLWQNTAPSQVTPAVLEDMRWLRNEATELRNRILEANLRLVIRMAYKHVGPLANVNELISDGNVSLMQAVEKFDYSRGFRFSTYASWAILKNFAKTIPEENYHGEKFMTGQAEMLDAVADAKNVPEREEAALTLRSAINRVLSKLTDRERQIVSSRFGVGEEDHAQTLGEVGNDLRVTRERVRQIEARAIEKIRVMLRKESVGLGT